MNNIEIPSKGYFSSISEFKLLQDIGVGSFGKVKLAIHIGTRRRYAIKIIGIAFFILRSECQSYCSRNWTHCKGNSSTFAIGSSACCQIVGYAYG